MGVRKNALPDDNVLAGGPDRGIAFRALRVFIPAFRALAAPSPTRPKGSRRMPG